MKDIDKAYMKSKQQDWEFDEPEASDYAQFVQQLKGIVAAMLFAAMVVK